MKIGILTFHHAANYGAVWQTLAFNNYLRSLHLSPEVIDYQPKEAVRAYRRFTWRSRHAPWHLLKSIRLSRTLSSRATLSSRRYSRPTQLQSLKNCYQAAIVGSDEVWNIEGLRGWQPAYFLDFLPDPCLRISYAASTGHPIPSSPHDLAISRLLSQFHSISVRDQPTSDFVSRLTAKSPKIVVDPTLLAGCQPQASNPSGQVAVYGGLPQTAKAWLRNLPTRQRPPFISLGFSNRIGGRNDLSPGLPEWISTIANARCVITTTFHGLMAAIVHRRPFWVLPRQDGATKVREFLTTHRLEFRLLDPGNLPDTIDWDTPPDYDQLWHQLEREISASREFLQTSLSLS